MQFFTIKVFLIACLLPLSFAWGGWECKDGVKVKFTHNKVDKSFSLSMCRSKSRESTWMNKKCYQKRGKCYQRIRKLTKNLSQKMQEFGNPYFQKCVLIGGDAIIIKYLWNKEWIDSSLCRFENGDVVSISFLP